MAQLPRVVHGGEFGGYPEVLITCEFLLSHPADDRVAREKLVDALLNLSDSEIYYINPAVNEKALKKLGLELEDATHPNGINLSVSSHLLGVFRGRMQAKVFPLTLPPKPILAQQWMQVNFNNLQDQLIIPDSSAGLRPSDLLYLDLGLLLAEDTRHRIHLFVRNNGKIQNFKVGIDVSCSMVDEYGYMLSSVVQRVLTETGWWCRIDLLEAVWRPR